MRRLVDADPETFDVSVLAPEVLEALEADSFWCLSKLLDGIQDNYIFAQPGIQRLVKKMETLCGRVDGASDCFAVILARAFFFRDRNAKTDAWSATCPAAQPLLPPTSRSKVSSSFNLRSDG